MTDVKPEPRRDDWEVVTPFGNATVKDSRSLDGTRCATMTFHDPIINRKHYKGEVSAYLTWHSPQFGEHRQSWWNVQPSYSPALTANAAEKLRDFLDEMSDKFDAYRAPLPPEEIREAKLRSLRMALANDLSGIMNRQAPTLEDLAIVLREALEATEAGKAYRP